LESIFSASEYQNLFSLSLDSNESKILSMLRSFGKAPQGFPFDVFINLLNHKNDNIRLLCVKHLGKFPDSKIVQILAKLFETESNTLVKREIVSSIGRRRLEKNVHILLKFCDDQDPKVVLQAIRGLLYFKDNPLVTKKLRDLQNHENEIISQILKTELVKDNVKKIKSARKNKTEYENLIIKADSRDFLKKLPEGIIDLTFTSPPYYNARDYTIYKSYEEYLTFLEDVFKEVHRVTSEGRFFLLNTSPVILPRVSRKHASTRYAIPFDIHPRIVKLGFDFIDDIIWAKPAPSAKNRTGGFFQHRKPLAYKPNVVVEYVMVYRKKTNKLIDWNMKQYDKEVIEKSKVKGPYEMTNLWQIAPSYDKTHPAPFPKKLVENVIKYYSYENDLVLDPFAGSGTTLKMAKLLRRNYLGIEISPKYCEIINKRLEKYNNQTLEAFQS